jgi:hypothetical protein
LLSSVKIFPFDFLFLICVIRGQFYENSGQFRRPPARVGFLAAVIPALNRRKRSPKRKNGPFVNFVSFCLIPRSASATKKPPEFGGFFP